jgi:putative endonuclease
MGAQSRDPAALFRGKRTMRDRPPKTFHVYIMASKPRGVLYVGMTSDLAGHAWKHRERVLEGFTKRYWVDRLVYFERHDDASVAARRERTMKRWRRDWKIELIEKHNPTWRDLFADVLRDDGFEW